MKIEVKVNQIKFDPSDEATAHFKPQNTVFQVFNEDKLLCNLDAKKDSQVIELPRDFFN